MSRTETTIAGHITHGCSGTETFCIVTLLFLLRLPVCSSRRLINCNLSLAQHPKKIEYFRLECYESGYFNTYLWIRLKCMLLKMATFLWCVPTLLFCALHP